MQTFLNQLPLSPTDEQSQLGKIFVYVLNNAMTVPVSANGLRFE